jgi:hypothetical protein
MVKLRLEYIWVANVADVLALATSVQYFWNSKTDKMQQKSVFIDFNVNKNV